MYAIVEFWHSEETTFEPVTERITAIGWRQQPDRTWKLVIETDSPEIVCRVKGGEVLDVDLYELASHTIGIRARSGDVRLTEPKKQLGDGAGDTGVSVCIHADDPSPELLAALAELSQAAVRAVRNGTIGKPKK